MQDDLSPESIADRIRVLEQEIRNNDKEIGNCRNEIDWLYHEIIKRDKQQSVPTKKCCLKKRKSHSGDSNVGKRRVLVSNLPCRPELSVKTSPYQDLTWDVWFTNICSRLGVRDYLNKSCLAVQ